jgi:hypothetical protein
LSGRSHLVITVWEVSQREVEDLLVELEGPFYEVMQPLEVGYREGAAAILKCISVLIQLSSICDYVFA